VAGILVRKSQLIAPCRNAALTTSIEICRFSQTGFWFHQARPTNELGVQADATSQGERVEMPRACAVQLCAARRSVTLPPTLILREEARDADEDQRKPSYPSGAFAGRRRRRPALIRSPREAGAKRHRSAQGRARQDAPRIELDNILVTGFNCTGCSAARLFSKANTAQ
jgi:hypothetical protein